MPVGRGVLAVADSFPCLDLFLQHLLIGDAAVEALGGENRAFGFRQIQPTPVFGCVVPREPFNKAAGFGGGKGVVKRAGLCVFRLSGTSPIFVAPGTCLSDDCLSTWA